MRFLRNLVRGAFRLMFNIIGFLCFLCIAGVVCVGVLVGYPPAQDLLHDAIEQGEKVKKALPSDIGDRFA